MQSESLKQFVLKIIKYKIEMQNLELKCAAVNYPTKLFDILSSFSNQDDGGIITFGVWFSNTSATKKTKTNAIF